jgi:hypothetical protein
VVYAESDGIYEGMTTYRRLSALVDASPRAGYVADFYWVRGGAVHRQFWHGPGGDVQAPGLTLKPQPRGSFAGEDVPVGQIPPDWHGSNGTMYLHGVRRDLGPPAEFVLDYDAVDLRGRIPEGRDPHLRLTCLTPASEVALVLGDPPKNRQGNPKHIECAVLTRKGKDLESAFVTVVEPYDSNPIVLSARRLGVETEPKGVLAAAVEIRLSNGRTDTILAAERPARLETETGVVLDGVFGIVCQRRGKPVFAKLCHGTRLACGGFSLQTRHSEAAGVVKSVSVEDPEDNFVLVEFAEPPEKALLGPIAIFENDREQDAAYDIRSLRRSGRLYRLSVGDKSFFRGYSDPGNFRSDLALNVRPGDRVRIPNSISLRS